MVNVPQQYATLLQQMSSATGIPYSVEVAQANAESGFNATAVSSAGAEGWLQFLPSTYDTYASQAGVSPGSEFDPASEAKVYDVFMKSLLQQEGGNLRNALAAYNAGPGNLAAGYGYADSILAAAGQSNVTVPGSAQTTGLSIPIPGLGGGFSVSGIVQDAIDTILKMLGLGSLKDMAERFALIVLGFVLVIIGIRILSSGSGGGQNITIDTSKDTGPEGTTTTRKVKHPLGTSKTTSRAAAGVGAEDAVEAAAIA